MNNIERRLTLRIDRNVELNEKGMNQSSKLPAIVRFLVGPNNQFSFEVETSITLHGVALSSIRWDEW